MAITADSTIGELLEALDRHAAREGWPDIEIHLAADGSCTLMEPETATEGDELFEAGEVCGFVERHRFTCVEELGELLAEGDERCAPKI